MITRLFDEALSFISSFLNNQINERLHVFLMRHFPLFRVFLPSIILCIKDNNS